MAGILETLIIHVDRMKTLSGASWSTANELADTIVREVGISFRSSHHIVARLVRNAIEEGKRPWEVTSEMVEKAALEMLGTPVKLNVEIIRRALDPIEFINSRVTEGSVNPKKIAEMLTDSKRRLKEERDWIKERENRLKEAEEKLSDAIDDIINSEL